MAAGLIQNRLCACNCASQCRSDASAISEASSSGSPPSSSLTLLPGALFGAANLAGTSIRSSNAASLVAEPSRSPRSRYGVANAPRSSTPILAWRMGRFTEMDGVRRIQGQVDRSRRVSAVKAEKIVIMVDPVEAKRLAAAEMKAIQARAKLQRRKEIEAINGGWAMVGLTTGIVIDGYTGKSILLQIAGYLDAVADFLTPLNSS